MNEHLSIYLHFSLPSSLLYTFWLRKWFHRFPKSVKPFPQPKNVRRVPLSIFIVLYYSDLFLAIPPSEQAYALLLYTLVNENWLLGGLLLSVKLLAYFVPQLKFATNFLHNLRHGFITKGLVRYARHIE